MSFSHREALLFHIGQAGIQFGNELWKLLSLEHCISNCGQREDQGDSLSRNGRNTFFEENANGRFIPRSIFIDTDPTTISELRNSEYSQLYNPDCLFAGKEDASSNFVRGYYTLGQHMIAPITEKIRQVIERTDNLQGFILCHSFGGGTGSGFTSKILESLVDEYPRLSKLQVGVYPAPTISTSVVEPYNSVLAIHSTLDQIDCSFLFDNQALYDIMREKLLIHNPHYSHLNQLMSQVISGITTSLRFDGSLNVDLDDFRTNLVPFPRIHFPVASYAPLMNMIKGAYEMPSVADITVQAFQSSNLMMKCNLEQGKYMACCMMYRGDVVAKDINSAIQSIKEQSKIRFVNWCPTGFKIGNNSKTPVTLPFSNLSSSVRGVSMIASNTAIVDVFKFQNHKFDLMYKKRAFIHWFLNEGLEQFELDEARLNMATLEKDYEEVYIDPL